MSNIKQNILPLPRLFSSYNQHDFILDNSNAEAYRLLIEKDIISLPYKTLWLIGGEGCGKTHLSHIWQSKHRAAQATPHHMDEYLAINHSHILCDDIESFSYRHLLYIINMAQEYGCQLLLTSRSLLQPKLADLRSRLNAFYRCLMKEPSEELSQIIIYKYFADRQITLDNKIIENITAKNNESERNISLNNLLNIIIQHIEENRGKISKKSILSLIKSL